MADPQAAVLFDGAAPAPAATSGGAMMTAPTPLLAVVASSSAVGGPEAENDAVKADVPPAGGKAAGAGRKRVFTFQKRWLHTLPIMERSLPDSVVGGTPMKPRINDAAALSAATAAASATGSPVSPPGESTDVVVCMLCDDPASKRDAPKIWSRLNCRRGRIENHLWSKHPEFMMLLKQKQETEGDLAAQIFLQSMRDGRCNVRSEISAGLYAHLHTSVAGLPGAKRALEQQHVDPHDPDAAQKRARMDAAKDTVTAGGVYTAGLAAFSAGGAMPRQPGHRDADADGSRTAAYDVGQAPPSADNEPSSLTALSSWSISLLNKVVVMTGGDNEVMMNSAAQLWSLGANVLITFSDRSMLDTFMSTSLARCPETHEHLGIPRGAMLPLLCDFTTHKQLDEWSRSIAARFPRVHCLINYVSVADDRTDSSGRNNGSGAAAGETTIAPGHKDTLGSTMDRLRSISGAILTHCVPPAAPGADGSCTVINVTSHVAAASDIVRSWAILAALDARSKLVHANFIEMPGITAIEASTGAAKDTEGSGSTQDGSRNAAATTSLLHTIALLCSPAGRLISGSVLRIESESLKAGDAASDSGTTGSEGGSSVTTTPVNGAEAAAGVAHSLGDGGDNIHVV